MAEEAKPEEVQKKGLLSDLKEKLLPDEDEKAAIFSTMVRLGVLIWSGGILTLNYVTFPGLAQQKIDPTFIASVFTGVLASFGIQTASKKGDGTMKMQNGGPDGVNGSGGPVQTLRIEQAPLKIIAVDPKKEDKPYTL
tara:strand:- start:71 stop:484 length:414 start_codon:yes stop_codon:yes gene_type:complete